MLIGGLVVLDLIAFIALMLAARTTPYFPFDLTITRRQATSVCNPSGTFCERTADTAELAAGSVDQPTPARAGGRESTLNSKKSCLIPIDTFRNPSTFNAT